MPVWQKANKLATEVFQLTAPLPRSEDYGLTSQIRRSSNSVSGNIAEGFGRHTSKDKSFFYTIARGSAFETQSHLLYGQQVEYFTPEKVENLYQEYNALILELNRLMRALG